MRRGRRPLRVALLAVAAPLLLLAVLAGRALAGDVFAWDERISEAIHAYQNRDTVWNRHVDVFDLVLDPLVAALGFLIVVALLTLLLARRRYRTAAFVALGVGGAALLGIVLKEVMAQPPVDPGGGTGFSFPSGHATRSMAAAAVVTFVMWPTRLRWTTTALAAVAVALIGIAVVYHEWHWVSDVLAGWALSIAWVGSLWLALHPEPGIGLRAPARAHADRGRD